ncbi:MAG TPA: hypothetical protein VKB88_28290 [Bryobacteraceae bacterium]|nr:hypothetical protein [Bryobacteraceae bacterium]
MPRDVWAMAALCAVTLAAFANSFSAGFALDNKGLILEDPRVHAATAENVGLIFQHSYWWPRGASGLYRPLTTLSYLFNYAVLGDGSDAAGYHWMNLLLHLASVVLVYALARKLLRDFAAAIWLAGLWAVHPVLTESVTNIVGRADLLAGAAVLGGFLLYLKSAEAAGVRRVAWLAGLMAVTALGVFSKESAVLILAVILLYELCWWRDRRVALILGCVAVLVPIQAMLYQRSLSLAADGPPDFPFTDNPLVEAGFWQAKLTAVKVMAHYLGLTVWPLDLSADYSYNQIPLSTGSAADWASCAVVAAAAAGVLVLLSRNRLVFFLAVFAFLTFLPTSNLLFPFGTIMAERFLYLPLVGLLACLVLGVFAAGRRLRAPWLAPALLGVLLCGFAVRTWARNSDWRDDLTLDRASVASAPGSFKTHRMLAEALYAAYPDHANLQEVIDEVEKSLAILQPVPEAWSNAEIYRFAGDCYLTRGDRQKGAEAQESYRKALAVLQRGATVLEASSARQLAKLKTEGRTDLSLGANANDDLYRLLADAYFRLGNGDKAFDAAIESRKREPMNPRVYSQLGHILFAVNQPADAAAALMEGMLVTSDMGLRRELMDLYRTGLDREGCAVVQGPNGPAMNPQCPVVHQTLCDAALDAIRIRLETGRKDIAAGLKRSFLEDYGCPAGPLNQVLPDARDSK